MRTVLAALLALCLAFPCAAASLEDDVMQYVAIFNGDKSRHSIAAESLSWMGISDTRVYDIVEQRLLADQDAARADRDERNRVAHYMRALGFSGQSKYAATLTNYVKDSVYSRHAREALDDLPFYQKWNPVISNRANFDPKYSDDVNRVMIMLRNDDMQLKRIGAKRVYFKNQDDVLLELLAQQIKLALPINNRESSDAIAWMVKALGRARKDAYRALLQEASEKAADPKVRQYAQQAIQGYR